MDSKLLLSGLSARARELRTGKLQFLNVKDANARISELEELLAAKTSAPANVIPIASAPPTPAAPLHGRSRMQATLKIRGVSAKRTAPLGLTGRARMVATTSIEGQE